MNIKFRMPKLQPNMGIAGTAKELLMTFVATTLSIVLTFGTANWMEKRQEEQARRLMAMTVILDIEKSLDVVKTQLEQEENGYKIAWYILEHKNEIDKMSADTLSAFINYLSIGNNYDYNLQFLKSNEDIFNSSQDSWRTLYDRKFISNVQFFYQSRSMFEKVQSEWIYFIKPISLRELYDMDVEFTTSSDNQEALIRKIRQLANRPEVKYYVEQSIVRMNNYVNFLRFIDLNEENKFLMNITDKDLEEFEAETIKKVKSISEKGIIGSWIGKTAEDVEMMYEFKEDHTFSSQYTIFMPDVLYMGKIALKSELTGTWCIENDSLALSADSTSIKLYVDENGIVYSEEKKDSVQAFIRNITSEQTMKYIFAEFLQNPRVTRSTNIDPSGKKMELTAPNGRTTHYKRKE